MGQSLSLLYMVLLTFYHVLSRCCKYDLHGPEANFWEDLEVKIMDSIRNTLDRRIQFYEEEIRKLSEQRFMPVWNFCNFFILKVFFSSCLNASFDNFSIFLCIWLFAFVK